MACMYAFGERNPNASSTPSPTAETDLVNASLLDATKGELWPSGLGRGAHAIAFHMAFERRRCLPRFYFTPLPGPGSVFRFHHHLKYPINYWCGKPFVTEEPYGTTSKSPFITLKSTNLFKKLAVDADGGVMAMRSAT